MKLEIIVPSTGNHDEAIKSWIEHGATVPADLKILNCISGPGAGFLAKLQKGYEESSADLLAYFHSDLYLHEEGWDQRVLRSLKMKPSESLASAEVSDWGLLICTKIPYRLQQLARFDFVSNLKDAEVHGRRNRNEEDIAVVIALLSSFVAACLLELGDGRLPPTRPCTCQMLGPVSWPDSMVTGCVWSASPALTSREE